MHAVHCKLIMPMDSRTQNAAMGARHCAGVISKVDHVWAAAALIKRPGHKVW